MAVYAVRWFHRWMQHHGLIDGDLCRAVREMARGLVDADLGGGLLKKRLARIGQGKRGGFRTIVATRRSGHWYFVYGYAKNERDNLPPATERQCRAVSTRVLSHVPSQTASAVEGGELYEVKCHEEVFESLPANAASNDARIPPDRTREPGRAHDA